MKKWLLTIGAAYLANITPLRPLEDGKMGEAWKAWKGEWAAAEEDEGGRYTVTKSKEGRPVLFYDGVGPIMLLRTEDEGRFDMEGLEMSVVLEEKEGVRTISAKSGLSGDVVKLEAVEARGCGRRRFS